MSEKYLNKYRIKSSRLPNYDYVSNGMYFITICTHNRKFYFGDIVDKEIQLSEIGKLAHKFWAEIPQHFPFVHLGEFVVMPNHTHGILIIDKPNDFMNPEINQTNENKNEFMSNISPKPGSISTIIRSYKSAVTKQAKKYNPYFAWQTRFHDHIIRDDRAFQKISNYIIKNPSKWTEDKFN